MKNVFTCACLLISFNYISAADEGAHRAVTPQRKGTIRKIVEGVVRHNLELVAENRGKICLVAGVAIGAAGTIGYQHREEIKKWAIQ